MHSMRTVRSSSRLLGKGVTNRVFYLEGCLPGGDCLGMSAWGCLPRVGVCAGGACLPGGVCPGGGGASQHALRQTPSPRTEFLTHACKNISFPQLRLWTVIIRYTILLSQVPRYLPSIPTGIHNAISFKDTLLIGTSCLTIIT